MEPLRPPDVHYLSAAVGWHELGDAGEAIAELDRISPEHRDHPHALAVRYEIHAKAAQWDKAAEVAEAIFARDQKAPGPWITLAYATRRKPGGGIPQAKQILAQAATLFPQEPLIAYNLACYECQLGDFPSARRWLDKSFQCEDAAQFKTMARTDPDLEPLRRQTPEPLA